MHNGFLTWGAVAISKAPPGQQSSVDAPFFTHGVEGKNRLEGCRILGIMHHYLNLADYSRGNVQQFIDHSIDSLGKLWYLLESSVNVEETQFLFCSAAHWLDKSVTTVGLFYLFDQQS
ncbi:hypothetical protein GOP47_0003043 [Adiantum capillus-veneris]|uniref:Uncharacterized protein n=1 Tax=Adiantum capillus-veneris TaxID=13818 RepID=A0A9D4VC24_ADICA|nr:hypothetical protein GOP47_0003043 [Adiantum capillus-veneris]